jgi:hypothetical protein
MNELPSYPNTPFVLVPNHIVPLEAVVIHLIWLSVKPLPVVYEFQVWEYEKLNKPEMMKIRILYFVINLLFF